MNTSKSWYLHCAAALVLTGLAFVSTAQVVQPESVGLSSERLQRINELVDRYVEQGDITGAVTLVGRNGQIAHLQAQGVMDIESRTPMRSDTIFRIASMSKPVAGVAIMILVEEGKVRLRDPVSRFLPSFEGTEVGMRSDDARPGGGFGGFGGPPPEFYTVPADRETTVRDLLTHTSGVLSGPMGNSAGRDMMATRHDIGLAWVDELGAAPLEFQPGARWAYSALAGFDVLSRIVEVVSGQRFEEFLQARIFGPLGIEDATFWPSPAQRERLVNSYSRTDDGLVPRENPDSMSGPNYSSGAGGLMTTASDYGRFAMMLANGGELDGVRILSPRSVELMGSAYIPDSLPGRPAGEGYGLSMRVVTDPVARDTYLTKGSFGWSGAYGTHFWVDPAENLVGVLMIQTPVRGMRPEFEDAVMQAVVDQEPAR